MYNRDFAQERKSFIRARDQMKEGFYFDQMMIDEIEMEVVKENERKEAK